jgi:transposase
MSKEVFEKKYKREIVKMIIEQNKTVAQVSRETAININTLYSWRKKYELEFIHNALPQMTERQRLSFFQKQVRQLEKENEILKRRKARIII